MISRTVARLRSTLNVLTRLDLEFRRLRQAIDTQTRDVARLLKVQDKQLESARRKQADRIAQLERELAAIRKEMQEQSRQSQLRLGRIVALLEQSPQAQSASPPTETYSRAIPLVLDEPPKRTPRPAADSDWLELEFCPGCGTVERTVVCEWNRSILREDLPEGDAAIYNYALCHGCGIVYAIRRPIGARFRALVEDFPETVGRNPGAMRGLLHPYPLSDADRARYRELLEAGVFVSDHQPREHLDGVFKDRLENAAHVEILGGLLDLTGARVLEVRSRAGTISDALRRYYGASVAAIPLFESQQFILRELYGIPCSDLLDFDEFSISFDGEFDLIVCNHMLTHVVRPDRFFNQVRSGLRRGGHLYLYNETDEAAFLGTGKSVLSAFNPLHMQAFDAASLIRLLGANGFETVFAKSRNGTQLCLARFTARREWTPIGEDDRRRRAAAYAHGRAQMILKAPEAMRGRFASFWDDTVETAVSAGIARFDDKGRLHLVKQ